jgi:uncharacterized protein with HEPN domain
MSGRNLKLLGDAIGAIDRVLSIMGAPTLEDYRANHLQRSAVERQLEILGEASAQRDKLDAGWRACIPDLGLAIGLRNRIIHGYDHVDDDMVYEMVLMDLPGLQQSLQNRIDALK